MGHVRLKAKVMAEEISVLHHRYEVHFKVYNNRKPLFEIVKIFQNVTVLFIFYFFK